MIVRCPDCRATYEVTTHKFPEAGLKVRCPGCKAVFPVRAESAAEPDPSRSKSPDRSAPARVAQRPKRRITDPALARRMARAMISEMLLNRRPERDKAVQDDAVLSRFGSAIASAYGIYRDKVSEDLARSPRLFREAVNDILGDGKPLL